MTISKSPILFIEDDENDVRLFQAALTLKGVPNPVWTVADGQEAMDYILGEGTFSDRKRYPLPEMIITDIKMPRVNGLEFLRWLRTGSPLSDVPVVVVSASDLEADIRAAYELGANGYVRKPNTFEQLQNVVSLLVEYWNVCEKPQAHVAVAA
jgi:CheY-like chemotaxis protein